MTLRTPIAIFLAKAPRSCLSSPAQTGGLTRQIFAAGLSTEYVGHRVQRQVLLAAWAVRLSKARRSRLVFWAWASHPFVSDRRGSAECDLEPVWQSLWLTYPAGKRAGIGMAAVTTEIAYRNDSNVQRMRTAAIRALRYLQSGNILRYPLAHFCFAVDTYELQAFVPAVTV